jgi:uncharacterized protein (DUF1800 family)
MTYGVGSATRQAYQSQGRAAYLQQQLQYSGDIGVPAAVRSRIDALEVSRLALPDLLDEMRSAAQQIKATDDPTGKTALKKAFRQRGMALAQQAAERHVLRALYDDNQLQEQLTWFWFNHFNVFQRKGNISWLVGDYEARAIRPHVFGKFRDLVFATLTHPAMLEYLDNAKNAADAVNENYARELMELHTLGVNGGYTQADVQALARILTGVGVDVAGKGCARGETQLPGVDASVTSAALCFRAARHDSGTKRFLGQDFPAGGGADEVVRAVDLLTRQPATAQFVARQLALYFLGDNPPQAEVDEMARRFSQSDGDIAQTLAVLFHSAAFQAAPARFKDPLQYVFSSMRLAYGSAPIVNPRPLLNWLNQLGEPLYGHLAPDGYGLRQSDWLSADQMSKRFDVANALVRASGLLYSDAEAAPADAVQQARRAARLAHPLDVDAMQRAVQPLLSDKTRTVLEQAENPDERASLLLSSPEWMVR